MSDGPHRHGVYRERCRDCTAVAEVLCPRCGRPLCARCDPGDDRRCASCEAEWRAHVDELAAGGDPPGRLRRIVTHVVFPSALSAALAFAALTVGGGGLAGPLAMSLALVAAVNLPLLALGPRELAEEITEFQLQWRINAARLRFLSERPRWRRSG